MKTRQNAQVSSWRKMAWRKWEESCGGCWQVWYSIAMLFQSVFSVRGCSLWVIWVCEYCQADSEAGCALKAAQSKLSGCTNQRQALFKAKAKVGRPASGLSIVNLHRNLCPRDLHIIPSRKPAFRSSLTPSRSKGVPFAIRFNPAKASIAEVRLLHALEPLRFPAHGGLSDHAWPSEQELLPPCSTQPTNSRQTLHLNLSILPRPLHHFAQGSPPLSLHPSFTFPPPARPIGSTSRQQSSLAAYPLLACLPPLLLASFSSPYKFWHYGQHWPQTCQRPLSHVFQSHSLCGETRSRRKPVAHGQPDRCRSGSYSFPPVPELAEAKGEPPGADSRGSEAGTGGSPATETLQTSEGR